VCHRLFFQSAQFQSSGGQNLRRRSHSVFSMQESVVSTQESVGPVASISSLGIQQVSSHSATSEDGHNWGGGVTEGRTKRKGRKEGETRQESTWKLKTQAKHGCRQHPNIVCIYMCVHVHAHITRVHLHVLC
jgi:hypothetical protein